MIFPNLDGPLLLLAVTIFVAGVARGLSGFGTGMIVVPVAGALYGPKAAVAILIIIDTLPAVPVTIPALRVATWKEVLPTVVGLILFIPLGVYILTIADPVALRWFICIAILFCAAALWRGWRYTGTRTPPKSFAVGGIAGILSGVAQIPAPPVLVYWLASPMPAAIVRANLLALFFISELMSLASAWTSGLFTPPVVGIGIAMAPVYFVALMAGWGAHSRTSDARYRQITLFLVILSAVLALPWGEIARAIPGAA
jgi:uncharacterized membrane protein YfcA